MPGIFCCFGNNNNNNDVPTARGANGSKDATHAAPDIQTTFPVNVSTKPDVAKEALEYNGPPSNQPRAPSPTVSPNLPVAGLLAGGRAGELAQGVLQGIDVQRKIYLLQGHWWNRVEGAVELVAKTYSAACVSVWILDESSDSFVALLSKGPMRQAVQPGHAVHLGSEYDANSPSSLTSLWETKAAQTYNVPAHSSNSSAASLSDRAAFPTDWKLLYNAHHFTDFLALPILASPLSGVNKPSPASIPSGSAGVLMGTLGGGTASGGAPNGSEDGSGSSGQQVVGAVTLYFSRPDRVSEQPPSLFNTPLEQDLVVLALASVLFSSGPESVRQICELVLAVQSAAGSGELAAAVAMGLTARLQQLFAVAPASLLALVPPKQVSAIVFRDQTVMPESVGGVMDTMVGYSSSQTLPLLHPALASVAGGGGASGAAAPYSGSHLHGGGGLRVQYRAAGIHVGITDASAAASIERSPSLLGTGLRGDGGAVGGSGAGTGATATTTNNNMMVHEASAAGGAGSAASRACMPNSRSMGVLAGHNPSGLFSCRLDRPPSRYKALVFPLSHTLLQVVLQQRQEKKPQGRAGQHGSGGGGLAAAGGARQTSALRDLCMAASAAAAAVSPSGATRGGWIVGDCNEHLHAVHSPSRDIYVMARVNGRRPHSLMLATADVWMPDSHAEGGAADGGGNSGNSHMTHIALYLAFQERLPRALLELVLADVQLLMRQLLAPLIRHRFETSLAEEWSALAGAANNLPSPGGPVLRITSSMSASQARHVPPQGLLLSSMTPSLLGETPIGAVGAASTTPPIAEAHSSNWLTRTGGTGTSPQLMLPALSGNGAATFASPNELDLEGLSAGEALQQMSVLVSSYMDTLQALQGQLMASDRVTESLRREDLPHLQLLEVLGHGGGGVVFRGKLHALEVAVKVFEVPGDLATAAGLPQHNIAVGAGTTAGAAAAASAGGASGNGAAASTGGATNQAAWPGVGDRRVLQRSALELAVTASLSHPHIIQVYSLYTNMVLVKQKPPKQGTSGVQLMELSAVTALNRTDEGIPCSALCMEYCDMATLAHAIDQHRFMTVTPLGTRRPALKAICTTLLEVALALRHLHARNLAHCDLKPANVLLKSSRRDSRGFTCKLADFGYVSVLKAAVPGGRPTILPEEACGTVTHMAPETFIKGQPLDFSVDTFSFGILMWELYMCARPYSDVPEDQIAQRVTLKGLRPTFPSDTPRSYGALARQCWSQDPNERPSASEIVAAIENMLQIMNTQLPAIPPHKPKPPAAAVVPAPQPGGASHDRGHVELVLEKPMPAMPRVRGSLNGGMVQLGPPQAQSPLGRVPALPPVTPPDDAGGPGTGQGASQPSEEAS
ncbi:hypothetical protein Vretimale_2798 [Volvox reticuliferus]|uniref:Protein kinase domain-containing protein n=1 Tax=Volvox reticuliferus TaxID=1737510 RepID=A0A8J4CDX0_9CHLO|nr:hypothetical protein Vretifemale_6814 [Volvox reticuliferus]GIL97338.1 hypothetical protein Vretimale_2798 [Volvox reticuliferus]